MVRVQRGINSWILSAVDRRICLQQLVSSKILLPNRLQGILKKKIVSVEEPHIMVAYTFVQSFGIL
jgi:hypothetical protein